MKRRNGRALAATFSILGMVVAALAVLFAAPAAQAYPQPVFSISVDHQVVVGGTPFTGTAKANITCNVWKLQFLSQSASGAGTTFSHKFSTPVVAKKTIYPMHATCTYATTAGAAGSALMVRSQTWTGDIPITVLPTHSGTQGQGHVPGSSAGGPTSQGGGGGGLLPNTGGPALWLLIAGVLLALGGTGAIARSRRHKTDSV